MAPSKKAAKKKSKAKKPPKAAPVSRTKKAAALEGPRPLSDFDFRFCHIFVQTNKMVEAWRQLRPDDKDPYKAAHRMMQRPEILEHIKDIYRQISKRRQQAAEVSARANLLSLELADDRLVELLQTPRKTLGQMLTRDTKQLLVGLPRDNNDFPDPEARREDETEEAYQARLAAHQVEKDAFYEAGRQATREFLNAPAPIEDTDLAKAIKLTYERKGGIVKADKEAPVTITQTLLYKPSWFGRPSEKPLTLEAARGESSQA